MKFKHCFIFFRINRYGANPSGFYEHVITIHGRFHEFVFSVTQLLSTMRFPHNLRIASLITEINEPYTRFIGPRSNCIMGYNYNSAYSKTLTYSLNSKASQIFVTVWRTIVQFDYCFIIRNLVLTNFYKTLHFIQLRAFSVGSINI